MIAFAQIRGSKFAPELKGKVLFRDMAGGVEVCIEVTGLPTFKQEAEGNSQVGPHGFHLHIDGNCSIEDENDPYKSAGGHFNPANQPHGNHAGDFPVLFSNNGYSRMCFYTNKFSVYDIIGRSVIIHQGPDDYKTQPVGGSGKRIGCGVVKELSEL